MGSSARKNDWKFESTRIHGIGRIASTVTATLARIIWRRFRTATSPIRRRNAASPGEKSPALRPRGGGINARHAGNRTTDRTNASVIPIAEYTPIARRLGIGLTAIEAKPTTVVSAPINEGGPTPPGA